MGPTPFKFKVFSNFHCVFFFDLRVNLFNNDQICEDFAVFLLLIFNLVHDREHTLLFQSF